MSIIPHLTDTVFRDERRLKAMTTDPTPNLNAPLDDMIADVSERDFSKAVIEASMTQLVIVDFWAPWCGPCKQMTPAIEKVVRDYKGKVKLAKIDVDKNQAIAAQLRIQSIPTVYAFRDGRPVDGFMGAKSETEIRAFIEKLGVATGEPSLDDALNLAQQSIDQGDITSALEAFSFVLEQDPKNLKAIAGLARLYINAKQSEQAKAYLDMAPLDCKDADIIALRSGLELAEDARDDIDALEAQIAKDPKAHETRLLLAKGLAAQGRMQDAIDHIFVILNDDPEWNEQAARHYLIKIFTAIGPMTDIAKAARRRLSALLFT